MSGGDRRCRDEWVKLGRADLRRARILLDAGDPAGAAFHLQQAIEKLLKGHSLGKGRTPRRTHDLELLLDEVALGAEQSKRFRPMCRDLTYLYIATRYPGDMAKEVEVVEVHKWLEVASDMFKALCET